MDNENNRLTIKEIKHCEKCLDISLKVSICGSVFAGLSFLLECVTLGIINVVDISTLWKTVMFTLSTSFMGLGFVSCEFSHYILKEREKMQKMLDDEKYKIYYEGRNK